MLNFRKLGLDPRMALPVLVLLLAGLLVWVMMATAKPLAPPSKDKPARSIDAVLATKQSMQLMVQSQGTIEPQNQSALISEVSGIVTWISPNLSAGGRIHSGEPLLRLEASDYQTAQARANAVLARANAELGNARNKSKRMETLAERKLVSQDQLDDARNALQLALASHAEAKANHDQAKRDVERTVITAPYDGQVVARKLGSGQFVSRGTELATIYARDVLEVRLPLANSELAFLDQSWLNDPGASKPSVVLSADFAGRKVYWDGQIARLESNIDTRSRMVYAIARIPPAQGESPTVGLFVSAEIAGRTQADLISIPRNALRDNNKVLIVNADRILESRSVEVLRSEGDNLIISRGLDDGDIVSVSINPGLSRGVLVKPNMLNSAPALQLEAAEPSQGKDSSQLSKPAKSLAPDAVPKA